jgi:hypothetical protein
MHQIDVDTDDWTCIGEHEDGAFSVNGGAQGQVYDSGAHDGQNFWFGGWGAATIRVYDDGQSERGGWLTFSPDEFDIGGGNDIDVIVVLDATGLVGGDYEASLHFISNDPDDPDVEFSILLHVNPAADIAIEWDEDYGYNEEDPDASLLDWNPAYPAGIFWGGPYTMEVEVTNTGVEDLEVNSFECDVEQFFIADEDMRDGFIVSPDETQVVELTFHAEEGGDYNGTFVVQSSSVVHPEMAFNVHAEAVDPPDIELDAQQYETVLNTGETEEFAINITNAGQAPLIWEALVELTEPDDARDAAGRELRGIRGPVAEHSRDDRGELLGQFQGLNNANTYCSPAGWDWDNERMWVTSYTQAAAAAYTHDNNYENFEEVARINPGNCMDGCWINGLLWLPTLGNAAVNRYNANGQNVGAVNFPFSVYGLAADVDNMLLFALSSADQSITVYPVRDDNSLGNAIGVIRNHQQFHENQIAYGFEWVGRHADGELWMYTYTSGRIHQIDIDTDDSNV